MNELTKEFLLETSKVVLGKEKEFKLALCAFLSGGHVLIEDVPGVGKTTFAKTLANILDLSFSRIQFTSDLVPSDVIGAQVYNQKDHVFSTIKGPIFSQFVLADELNRANPKSQSSLLEAMEEKQVSIDKESYKLPDPFFVVATQNPNTQIGTHLLPESQLDRFMIRIKLGYPHSENEKTLIKGFNSTLKLQELKSLHGLKSLNEIKTIINHVKLSDKLVDYIYNLISVSRNNSQFHPLSPRCGIDLSKMSRAWAYLEGRDYALPDDVKCVLNSVVSHRLNNNNPSSLDDLINYVKVD